MPISVWIPRTCILLVTVLDHMYVYEAEIDHYRSGTLLKSLQIAGVAGKYLKRGCFELGRITGLDPAGPLFVDQ